MRLFRLFDWNGLFFYSNCGAYAQTRPANLFIAISWNKPAHASGFSLLLNYDQFCVVSGVTCNSDKATSQCYPTNVYSDLLFINITLSQLFTEKIQQVDQV